MNVEQLIKNSEPKFRQHVVNKTAFKNKLFQEFDGMNFSKKRPLLTWKKSLILSVIIVPMFGAVAGAAVYKWATSWNNKFYATNSGATDAAVAYVPPFWETDYLNSLPDKPISIVDLQTSRTQAGFPIKEPQSITGWTKVFGNGFIEGKVMPLKFLDVYQSADGKRVSVLQQKIGNLNHSGQAIMNYPKSAQPLSNFSPDLAVLVHGVVADQSETKASELDVYHKNSDNTVTEFMIASTASEEQALEMFANKYLQAPTN